MKSSTLLLVTATFLISVFAVWLVLSRMSPYADTAWLSITLFFVSAFIMTTSFFTLLGSLLRLFLYRHETYFFHFLIALRQGALLALFAIGYLALSVLHVGTWWNIILLFLSCLFVELYLLNRHIA